MSKLILKRLVSAALAMVNPNSSTFWIGPVNALVSWLVLHFHLSDALANNIKEWAFASVAILFARVSSKVFNGAFPAATYGTLTPATPTAPPVMGTPVMATVTATKKTLEDPSTPTSPARK